MVGDRDRPEAAVAGRLQQHLDRRRAVAGVVGVHVQVDLDQGPLGEPRPQLRIAARVVAARHQTAVDRFELVDDPAPLRRRGAGRGRLVAGGEVAPQQLGRPGLVTVRASMRPKRSSTRGRATWVESTRSCGA